ncbi:MAG TPA: hypothetical protein DD735_11870 [Clostridiales bacterium]|nr:hypothetical protein [Clostridiales bacterium]
MNGIEKITAHIAAGAEEEIREMREASDARCAEIMAEYERQAQAEYWQMIKDGARQIEDSASRAERTAGLEAKKLILAMKQQMVSRAFELAREKIAQLPEQDYVGFLARMASSAAITGQEELIFNERDSQRVGRKVVKAANEWLARGGMRQGLTLSDETREISGGLVLRQGDIEVNCTVDTMLALGRGELAAQVAEVLFKD